MTSVMGAWRNVETLVLSPRPTHHPPSNIPVRISVSIALSNVTVNVLREHLCVGLAVFQTVKSDTIQFVMAVASQATKNVMVYSSVLKVLLSVTGTVGPIPVQDGTFFVMANVNLSTNLVMGSVQRVTSNVMETVGMKSIIGFVMGNVSTL